MAKQKSKISGGGRKYGRQREKPAQKRYTMERRWIKNKVQRLRKYLKRHPNWNPGNLKPEVAQTLGL